MHGANGGADEADGELERAPESEAHESDAAVPPLFQLDGRKRHQAAPH